MTTLALIVCGMLAMKLLDVLWSGLTEWAYKHNHGQQAWERLRAHKAEYRELLRGESHERPRI